MPIVKLPACNYMPMIIPGRERIYDRYFGRFRKFWTTAPERAMLHRSIQREEKSVFSEDPRKEEKILADLGVDYEVQNVRLGDIDPASMMKYNARFEHQVSPDTVAKYVTGKRAGNVFPLPTLYPMHQGRFRYGNLSGAHRNSADLELYGPDHIIEAFVVKNADEKLRFELGIRLNASSGMALSKAEMLFAAVEAREQGRTDEEAAAMCNYGVTPQEVKEHHEMKLLDRQLSAYGLDPSLITRKGDKAAIAKLNDVTWMREVVTLLQESGGKIPSGAITDLCRDLRNAKTYAERTKLVEDARTRGQQGKRRGAGANLQSSVSRFKRTHGMFMKGFSVSEVVQAPADHTTAAQMRNQIADIIAQLTAVDQGLASRFGA